MKKLLVPGPSRVAAMRPQKSKTQPTEATSNLNGQLAPRRRLNSQLMPLQYSTINPDGAFVANAGTWSPLSILIIQGRMSCV